MFYALGASISGFRYARSIIIFDGTQLRGKYQRVLFVVVTKDGNNQIFPLAFEIGDVECDESWKYFIYKLKEAFGCPRDLLIASDGHKSISNAIREVFPLAHHGLCCYHIQKHLVKYGQHVVAIFNDAAYSYRIEDYNRHMKSLEIACPAAATYLKEVVGENKWAHVKFPVQRFEVMNSNVIESMNNHLLWARKFPVSALLEVCRSVIEEWISNRHKNANECSGPLTNHAYEILMKAVGTGSNIGVQLLSDGVFKVISNRKNYVVDLREQKCSCMMFQHDMISCNQAAAAIRYLNHDQTVYIHDYYKVSTLRQIWGRSVTPVPHLSDWFIPANIKVKVCEPPDNPRHAGRPKERRYTSGVEASTHTRKVQTCLRCQGTGHNRKTCTAVIPQLFEDFTMQPTTSKKGRAKKKCSICHSVDHTAPKYPTKHHFDLNEHPM